MKMPFIFPPYIPRYWTPVSDQLRGGVSTSTLTPSDPTGHHGHTAIFRGIIDPSILGAAFASQRCSSEGTDSTKDGVWDLSEFGGVEITASFPDHSTTDEESTRPKKYTLVFKDAHDNESGGLTYEYTFEPEKKEHFVAWEEFKPVKRGKELDGCERRLDTQRVTSVSWMCRSFFKEQAGAFEVELGELRAAPKPDDHDGDDKDVAKEEVLVKDDMQFEEKKGATMNEKKGNSKIIVEEMEMDSASVAETPKKNRGCCVVM